MPDNIDDDILRAMEDCAENGAVEATCPDCGDIRIVEPDAEDYECFTPGCTGRITSPLREQGLI